MSININTLKKYENVFWFWQYNHQLDMHVKTNINFSQFAQLKNHVYLKADQETLMS